MVYLHCKKPGPGDPVFPSRKGARLVAAKKPTALLTRQKMVALAIIVARAHWLASNFNVSVNFPRFNFKSTRAMDLFKARFMSTLLKEITQEES
jgi:hypothetical protein